MRLLRLVALWVLPTAAIATVKQFDVRVRMRDGVHLSTNVYRPSEHGRFPTILIRTPYGKGSDITPNFEAFVERGYAFVVQDVRGRYASEGAFMPFSQEPVDGDDTLNWIAAQPWSDGGVGMMGGSYLGICQWKVATLNNPHLKAIFPVVSGDDDYRDRFYSTGGAMKLGSRLLWTMQNLRKPGYEPPDFRKFIWTLPLRRTDLVATGSRSRFLQTVFDHPSYDDFWQSISARKRLKDIQIPVFSVGGWFDNFVEGDLDAFATLHKRSGAHRILIGPWPHNMSIPLAGVDLGKEWSVPLRRLQLEWFDRWLKGRDTPVMSRPPVRIFVMGVNQWRDEYEWPLARARSVSFYLSSSGDANSGAGDGVLLPKARKTAPADSYVYDPKNPVPTRGGPVCCDPKIFPWGPLDQRPVEKRGDVLVYSTPPLREDLEATGPIRVVLYIRSSAVDTDFTAKLVDVFPSGEARGITDGILRARYRHSLEKPKLLEPDKIHRIEIDAGVTSNVFRKGHRIRLEISSSNFPRFDRNPNTGRPVADETELRKAAQTVFHDGVHSSRLVLPVIPESGHRALTTTAPARYSGERSARAAR